MKHYKLWITNLFLLLFLVILFCLLPLSSKHGIYAPWYLTEYESVAELILTLVTGLVLVILVYRLFRGHNGRHYFIVALSAIIAIYAFLEYEFSHHHVLLRLPIQDGGSVAVIGYGGGAFTSTSIADIVYIKKHTGFVTVSRIYSEKDCCRSASYNPIDKYQITLLKYNSEEIVVPVHEY